MFSVAMCFGLLARTGSIIIEGWQLRKCTFTNGIACYLIPVKFAYKSCRLVDLFNGDISTGWRMDVVTPTRTLYLENVEDNNAIEVCRVDFEY